MATMTGGGKDRHASHHQKGKGKKGKANKLSMQE